MPVGVGDGGLEAVVHDVAAEGGRVLEAGVFLVGELFAEAGVEGGEVGDFGLDLGWSCVSLC